MPALMPAPALVPIADGVSEYRCSDCGSGKCLQPFCSSGQCTVTTYVASLRATGWTASIPDPCELGTRYRCTVSNAKLSYVCDSLATAAAGSSGSRGDKAAFSYVGNQAAFSLPAEQTAAVASARTMNAGVSEGELRDAEMDALVTRDRAAAKARAQAALSARSAAQAAFGGHAGEALYYFPPAPPPPPLEVQLTPANIADQPANVQRQQLAELEQRTKQTRRDARNRYRLQAPLHRRGHSMNQWGATQFLLFGGLDRYGTLHNGLWTWDLIDHKWTHVDARGVAPAARYRHVAITVKEYMLVFGGSDLTAPRGDLWAFSRVDGLWSEMAQPGERPVARERACAVEYRRHLLLFGGYVGSSAGDGFKPRCVETGSDGSDYRGTVSWTSTRRKCQAWDAQYPHKHTRTPANFATAGLAGNNYCRNPDGAEGPWCYTTDPSVRKELCSLPACLPQTPLCVPAGSRSNSYTGTISVTESGLRCQKWTAQAPHAHSYTPANYPDANLGDHNYCRNPNNARRPWCITDKPYRRAEFCAVPACSSNDDYMNDVWEYDMGFDTWTEHLPSSTSAKPMRRAGHACVLEGHRMYVFGGVGGEWRPQPLDDLWVLDLQGSTWRQAVAVTAAPTARYGHSMAPMGMIALWGGTDGARQYNDFWAYDVLTNGWVQGRYAPGTAVPLPRAEHGGVAQGMHYCIFGGFGGAADGAELSTSSFLNDLWCVNTWSLWKMTWANEEGVPMELYESADWRRGTPMVEAVSAHQYFEYGVEPGKQRNKGDGLPSTSNTQM